MIKENERHGNKEIMLYFFALCGKLMLEAAVYRSVNFPIRPAILHLLGKIRLICEKFHSTT